MRPTQQRRKFAVSPAPGSSHDRILQAAKSLFAGKGYDNTSTVAIARLAGTSESQLMKHFGSKEGLLEAIFEKAWQKINWSVRRAMEGVDSPPDKFNALVDLTLAALAKDAELRALLLLEGRHIRKDGKMILLDQGFLEYVRMTDGILREMQVGGQLRSDVQVETIRSALMGAIEGLLRDQLLADRVDYPAPYNARQLREVFGLLTASFTPAAPVPAPGKARP